MAGPRIYTESWERLKTAAREMEEKEEENNHNGAKQATKPKREAALPASRGFVVATLVLSALCILLGILWFDAQSRLIQATRETGDLKAQLDLIQERFKNMDKDRERIAEENALLRREEEETRADAVAREREIEALKAQKERVGLKPKPPAARTDVLPAPSHTQSKPSEQPVSAGPIPDKPPLQTLEKTEQQGVQTYSIR
jgi:hypothetical protein